MRRRRLYISAWAFAIALAAQILYRVWNPSATYDLYFPICAAWNLLHGITPYAGTCVIVAQGIVYPPNPMTTVLVALPFAPLGYVGGIVLWSLGVGLLVYGILRTGEPWRLLLFASAPFVQTALFLQWSPFLAALVFLPELAPLALVKPQLSPPILLPGLTRRRVELCLAFGLVTFLIDPLWVFKWLPQTGVYDGFIPLLVFPIGLLLLSALPRWRERNSQFLLLMSAVPQRGFYDSLLLWTLPTSARQMLTLSALSWLGYLASLLLPLPYPLLVVSSCYLPILVMQLVPVPLTSISRMRALALRLAAQRRLPCRRGNL